MMGKGSIRLFCGFVLVSALPGRGAEDPLMHDPMSDRLFMKAAWHMKIEAVTAGLDRIVITTTGAVFTCTPADDTIRCTQRIGKKRSAVTLVFGHGALKQLRVKRKDTGAVILESAGGLIAKVNCDSLLMLRTPSGTTLACRPQFKSEVDYHVAANRLWLDRFGCVGVYPIDQTSLEGDGKARDRPIYRLGQGGEIWVSIGPPRPYPWKQSIEFRPLWQGSWESPQQAVPSDEKIKSYVGRGNLLWLQSEKMLWKNWHKAFEPRLPDELRRVIATSHQLGIRVMVYASPYYFTKGTKGDRTNTGENLGRYVQALKDYLRKFPETDGVYFDGVYGHSVKNTYICCRLVRELIGDDRVLMIHSTFNAPGGKWGRWAFNPAADTWATAQLRGEGMGFAGSQWLRYFVSCYQTSNAIGFVCNNAGYYAPTRKQVEMTLRANCRLAYMTADTDGWLRNQPINRKLSEPAPVTKAKHIKALTQWYWPRLNKDYREWFEKINESDAFDVPPESIGARAAPASSTLPGHPRKAGAKR